MGAYNYIKETLQEEYKERPTHFRERLSTWRKSPTVVRVERPTNLARARSLGYKAKKGIFVVRVRIDKGLRKRRNPKAGRSARHNYRYVQPSFNQKVAAEQKAARKHRNAEVINSYYVGEDGQHKFYEVILAEREEKSLDKFTKNIVKRVGRAFRGLTSAAKKARGLRAKGRRKQRL
ncbi:MAG: 50S ribosomal protein L15e [Methanobacteriota archaeon]|nr:MAG: 50S ribosomal protein L15e [Euryarchaeota archaeon]